MVSWELVIAPYSFPSLGAMSVGRHSRELCSTFFSSILAPREVRARFLPCLSQKNLQMARGWMWGELPGTSSESQEQTRPAPGPMTQKGSHLANQAEHL